MTVNVKHSFQLYCGAGGGAGGFIRLEIGKYRRQERGGYSSHHGVLNINEEFFQKYNTKTNPIFFFINYGFFPEKYFSCFISL